MLTWVIICFVLLVMTYGLNRTLSGVGEVTQTAQDLVKKGQNLNDQAQALKNQAQNLTDQAKSLNDQSQQLTGNLPSTVVPRSSTVSGVSGASEETEKQVGGDTGNGYGNGISNFGVGGIKKNDSFLKKNDGLRGGSVGDQLSDTPTQGSGALGAPAGAPVRAFVEFGEVASAHPKDIWLDNVALTIPPSNVGTTDIIFVDAGRPQQCYQKCKTSPFCRFFSYWKETGVCNLHQTLQNGETSPENMIRYAYTVPFSQHWLSGYVRKSGDLVPPYQL